MPQIKREIIDAKRDPRKETERFQAAQEAKDYETMFDVLLHSSAQVCKRKGQGKWWDSDKLYDVASEMAIYLMERYKRNPEYRMSSHITQVYYAYMHCVYGTQLKRDNEAKRTCSYEAACLDKTYGGSYSSLEDDVLAGL